MNEPTLLNHLSEQQVKGYREKSLRPVELLAAGNHLAECTECRARIGIEPMNSPWQNLKADLQSIGEADLTHLLYEQIADYVDGKSDDVEREIIESHITICHRCADELRDLKEFSTTILKPQTVEAAVPARQPAWQKFVSSWSAIGFGRRFFMARVALAMLLIVAGSLVLVYKYNHQSTKPQVAIETGVPTNPGDSKNGAQPTVPNREPMVAQLKDASGEITLTESGTLSGIGELSVADQQIVKDALQSQNIALPSDVKDLIGKTGTLMGSPNDLPAFKPVRPVGTVIQTMRPTFQWQNLQGASSYRISVFDSNFNKVAESGSLTTNTWHCNVLLKQGTIYLWQVTAVKDGKEITSPTAPAPEAKFRVISHSGLVEIEQIRAQSGGSHLVMGTFYAREGLLDDAEKEFQALVAANPDSAAAKKLLRSVRTVRH